MQCMDFKIEFASLEEKKPKVRNTFGCIVCVNVQTFLTNLSVFCSDTLNQMVRLLDGKCAKTSHTSAVKERNNLFHCVAVTNNGKKALLPKVCCLCDAFVKHGDEKLLPLKSLLNEKVMHLLSIEGENWSEMAISDCVKNVLQRQCTQQAVTTKNTMQVHCSVWIPSL